MAEEIREWVVVCVYRVEKEMIVTVNDGDDPLDPDFWQTILDERDLDSSLWDTKRAEPNT